MGALPSGRHLGARRSRRDVRDKAFHPSHLGLLAAELPAQVDLRDRLPPCWDQGQLGSCSAHAGAGLMAFLFPGFEASRLQIYWQTRTIEGDVDQDGGAETRDMMKELASFGAAPEADWPYDPARFRSAPPIVALNAALEKRLGLYTRLADRDDMLACLAAGRPFVLGFEVPTWFDDPDIETHGVLALPGGRDPQIEGGHDVLAVGYDRSFRSNPDFLLSGVDPALVEDEALLIRNSWGQGWGVPGKPGHFWMPLGWAADPKTGGDAWTGHLLVERAVLSGPTVAGVPVDGTFVQQEPS